MLFNDRLFYPKELGLSLDAICSKPEDNFQREEKSVGDFVSHENDFIERRLPPVRVYLGHVTPNNANNSFDYVEAVFYIPEADQVERVRPSELLRLKRGPTLFQIESHEMRREVIGEAEKYYTRAD